MPKFSKTSQDRLKTCHNNLQILMNEVVKRYDCTVLCGHRTIQMQQQKYNEGRSQIDGITTMGKHNYLPSLGVDVSPYPIPDDWGDYNPKEKAKFYHFAGYVQAVADELGIKVIWGGDWDSDLDFDDQTFDDLIHWELAD